MAKGKQIDENIQQEVIKYYLNGNSFMETGKTFGISGTYVGYILKRHNISRRSVAEGNSLKWKNENWRNNQIEKRVGIPSPALGKTWIINHIIRRPSTSGEKNHFWKGGKTSVSRSIRMLPEYKFWRNKIFERDEFACQNCGRKRKIGDRVIIQADHIIPLSKLMDDYNIKSSDDAIKCEKLWDITNGKTLCKECHKLTSTYGKNRHRKVCKYAPI